MWYFVERSWSLCFGRSQTKRGRLIGWSEPCRWRLRSKLLDLQRTLRRCLEVSMGVHIHLLLPHLPSMVPWCSMSIHGYSWFMTFIHPNLPRLEEVEPHPAVVTAAREKPKKKEKALQVSDMNFSQGLCLGAGWPQLQAQSYSILFRYISLYCGTLIYMHIYIHYII